MNEDVYELKFEVSDGVLDKLNDEENADDRYFAFWSAIEYMTTDADERIGREGYIDLLDAALSGKRVVNPKTPAEELKQYASNMEKVNGEVFALIINKTVDIIAKDPKHSEVKSWLGGDRE